MADAVKPSYPVTPAMRELVAAGLRHAEGLTVQLAKPDWRPSRAHVEQARNSIDKLAMMLQSIIEPQCVVRAQTVQVPERWKLVPIVPTRKMIDRGYAMRPIDICWSEMLEAAPAYNAKPANRSTAKATANVGDDRSSMGSEPEMGIVTGGSDPTPSVSSTNCGGSDAA